jgi:hypothetical protein
MLTSSTLQFPVLPVLPVLCNASRGQIMQVNHLDIFYLVYNHPGNLTFEYYNPRSLHSTEKLNTSQMTLVWSVFVALTKGSLWYQPHHVALPG